MSGDTSDSSDDSDAKTNETACTVKHQITNGKCNQININNCLLINCIVYNIYDSVGDVFI